MPAFNALNKNQQGLARRLSTKYGASVSQAAKYLDDFAAHDRGDIDDQELTFRVGKVNVPLLHTQLCEACTNDRHSRCEGCDCPHPGHKR